MLHPCIPIPVCANPRQIAEWNARTPAEKLAGAHYSRARRIAGRPNGRWTAKQWLALVAACGSVCYWCHEFTDHPSPDHLVPLARLGTNGIKNIVVSCPRCQSRRQDKTEAEYRAWLAAKEADAKAA